MMYQNELNALHKSGRYRSRSLYDEGLLDFSSNDYLGLGHMKALFERAVTQLSIYPSHAPKASLLVNGYHPIHEEFEQFLVRQNGFEAALVCGSGFLANFSLIEALPRKKDLLLLDEEYHASGVVASRVVDAQVLFFRHNDANHLEELIRAYPHQRAIVAVEGIYSMSGDLLNPDIFDVADAHHALLLVDEAHSVGVVGESLRGVFDLFGITPKENHIKMGTLGKALGSYGAYILCSESLSHFLLNRAKAVIYTTAPSLFDIALGYQGFLYLLKHKNALAHAIKERQQCVEILLEVKTEGLIVPFKPKNKDVLSLQKRLQANGFLVGAIRAPTVKEPIIRLIPRLQYSLSELENVCTLLLKEDT